MAEAKTVLILMGSDSDLPVMQEAKVVLDELGVGSELRVLSAHRTPERTREVIRGAEAAGVKVIIAGAGGAAHLAGAAAAQTSLPVIGVPLASGALNGVDSLYSTVQMPPGVPVATVAIGGARNAGILAAQILALSDGRVREALKAQREKMAVSVEQKDRKVRGGRD
jgi:5-(carboxyamino)imidazole ribonucleotide mutase